MRFILIMSMLFFSVSPISAQDVTLISFICKDFDDAVETAVNMAAIQDKERGLPKSCRWVIDRARRQVTIDKIHPSVVIHVDHKPIFVGKVSNPWLNGWSAGTIDLLM